MYKKLVIVLLFGFILFGCKGKEEENIDDTVTCQEGEILIDNFCEPKPRELQSGKTGYDLDVYLNPDENTLQVSGKINYYNEIDDLDELYIMIYPNALNSYGSGNNVNIEYITIDGEELSYDFANADNTAYHFNLSKTYQSNEDITIEFDYTFTYWDTDRILGMDDYFLTMFFYPFVAMYDETGWNIDPYTFAGESYYNEVGDYIVDITAPKTYKIATSGYLENLVPKGRNAKRTYFINDARDFSFSASSLYSVYERMIDGRHYSIYSLNQLSSQEVDESFGYLEDSFNVFESDIGPYTYNHFTLEYGYFYGMESTGVIYCSEDIDEGTVVHEVAHQWFYSMIGNDQYNNSFLDESLTTFISSLYYYDAYGISGYQQHIGYRNSMRQDLSELYEEALGRSLLETVDEMDHLYALMIYYHGPTLFTYYVDNFLDGNPFELALILQEYYDEYHGEIATLDGFLDILERESGKADTKEWFLLQLNEVQALGNMPE